MNTTLSSTPECIDIFRQLDDYPWDKDKEFQGGLSAILGPNPSASQIGDLTLRAQCFYLSRKKSVVVDFDEYKNYLAHKSPKSTPSSGSTPIDILKGNMLLIDPNSASGASTPNPVLASQTDSSDAPPAVPPHAARLHHGADLAPEPKTAPYPTSFAQIVELITSGAPIPGIREIPSTLLTDQATINTVPKRRKPWEKDVPDNVIEGKEGGVVGGTFGDRRDDIVAQELPE